MLSFRRIWSWACGIGLFLDGFGNTKKLQGGDNLGVEWGRNTTSGESDQFGGLCFFLWANNTLVTIRHRQGTFNI